MFEPFLMATVVERFQSGGGPTNQWTLPYVLRGHTTNVARKINAMCCDNHPRLSSCS